METHSDGPREPFSSLKRSPRYLWSECTLTANRQRVNKIQNWLKLRSLSIKYLKSTLVCYQYVVRPCSLATWARRHWTGPVVICSHTYRWPGLLQVPAPKETKNVKTSLQSFLAITLGCCISILRHAFVVIYVQQMRWQHTSYTQSWSTSCWLLSFPSHISRYVGGGGAFAREDKTCASLHFYFECLLPFPSYSGGDHPLPLIIKSPALFLLFDCL